MAQATGTLDFQVHFRTFGDEQLPAGGDLNIEVLDRLGHVVAGKGSFGGHDTTPNARVRIPALAGQTYYLHVSGANERVVNGYSLAVWNSAAPVPYDLELVDLPVGDPPPRNSDTGRSPFDNVTRDRTPTIVFRLDDASFEFTMQGAGNGAPTAGDWDGDGRDEVATRQGNSWFIDESGIVYTPEVTRIIPTRIATSMQGLPIAGDWDGDGDDNVGAFHQDQFFLDTDDDFGASDLTVVFPEFDFGGLKPQPVAHDWDRDGDDNIGLFVRRETGSNSGAREAGEWFLDINTILPGTGIVQASFKPPPTGQIGVPLVNQDIFYNVGDERKAASLGNLIPLAGNFDPPVGAEATGPARKVTPGDPARPWDVNGDGRFDQLDIVQVQQGGKYLTGKSAERTEGDWKGDGLFDPRDIVAALQEGKYQGHIVDSVFGSVALR